MKTAGSILLRWTIIFVVATGLSAFYGCSDKHDTNVDPGDRLEKVKLVKICTVNLSPPEGHIEHVGTLLAHRKVRLSSETGGTIEGLYFEKGDTVRKGQMLCEISTSSILLEVRKAKSSLDAAKSHLEKIETGSRPEEILIAKSALRETEAVLLEAEHNFKRINDLHKFNSVSESAYDSARRSVEMARAKVESARQLLSLARQGPRLEDRKTSRANVEQAKAALAMAEDRLWKSRMHAPCDGIIAFRDVEQGEFIPRGATITKIVDLKQMKIQVSLSEKDVHILKKHKRFEFTVDAIPQKTFSCQLSFVSPAADPATRSFQLELMVETPDPSMADGMTVRIKFPVVETEGTLKVHSCCISEENGKIGLYVVEDGKAVFKKVTLGTYYDQQVAILSGLADKDLIITNPAGINSGDRISY